MLVIKSIITIYSSSPQPFWHLGQFFHQEGREGVVREVMWVMGSDGVGQMKLCSLTCTHVLLWGQAPRRLSTATCLSLWGWYPWFIGLYSNMQDSVWIRPY